ncbi:MAG: hypothetical protein M1833_005267 [Piccolia ochrophora]|nr:MAG: hypothetical protein M1833_005267 [Piccolia ochrophora]
MAPQAKQKSKSKSQLPSENVSKSKPQWPPLHPLIPASDLALTILVPDQILLIRNFWTSSLCKSYVSFLSSLPLQTTPGRPKKGDAVRVNDRFQIADPDFAKMLWESTALKELVLGPKSPSTYGDDDDDAINMHPAQRRDLWGGDVVGLNPNIRIYRYSQGQYFDKHYDDSNALVLPAVPPTPAVTTWTLLVYLTSPTTGCVGGETAFYPDPPPTKTKATHKAVSQSQPAPVVVALETGMALLHKHGADCMLHEGREVLAGEKWVLRSDLCVRR